MNSLPRVNHIDAVLEGSANNIILRKVRSNRGQARTDTVCFIGLVMGN
jgi:hypothetical protein